MSTIRDALGRFLPRLRHDPRHPYVLTQEDGAAAYRSASYADASGLARETGARLMLTREGKRPLCLLDARKRRRAVL